MRKKKNEEKNKQKGQMNRAAAPCSRGSEQLTSDAESWKIETKGKPEEKPSIMWKYI